MQTHLDNTSKQVEASLEQLYYCNNLVSKITENNLNELYTTDLVWKSTKKKTQIAQILGGIRPINESLIEIALCVDDETVCTSSGVFPIDYYFSSICNYQEYTKEIFSARTGRKAFCILEPTVLAYNVSTSWLTSRAQNYTVLPVTSRIQTLYGNCVAIYMLNLEYLVDILQSSSPYNNILAECIETQSLNSRLWPFPNADEWARHFLPKNGE